MKIRKQIAAACLIVLLAACSAPAGAGFGDVANQPHQHTGEGDHTGHGTTSGAGVQPVLATSELVVGPNRLAFGLLENNLPIPDAKQTVVKVRYFMLKSSEATATGEEEARYYGEGLGERGVFIVHPTFDAPGNWGLEVQFQRPGKQPEAQRIALDVKAQNGVVNVGQPAPTTKSPTAASPDELKRITSDASPDPRLYQLSVDQAIKSGKPSIILFATPGFCQTALCGPGVGVVGKLKDKFDDRINAVHVEIYQYPFEKLTFVPAMQEWGLQTEPWLFLVDAEGKVAGRFEGGITIEELEPEVAKVVGS